jgi:hypothetical protein
MKNSLIIVFYLIIFLSCSDRKRYINDLTIFQNQINSEFKDVTSSPLSYLDRQNFISLDFFEYDSLYLVKAIFKKSNNELVFKMKTTTDSSDDYINYGTIDFQISNKFFSLNLYQKQDFIDKEGYENYLFLPFLDNTNGSSTYSGGRYIDLEIPSDSIIFVDFNNAYNPYCVYDEKYSCPIVPRENYVSLKINAGVKDFKK